MREHHALGCPSCARGVNQRRQIVAITLNRAHRIEFAGLVERDHLEMVIVDRGSSWMHRDDALNLRKIAKAAHKEGTTLKEAALKLGLVTAARRKLGVVNGIAHLLDHGVAINANKSRARICDYVMGLLRAAGGIERRHHCAQSKYRLIKDYPMRSVFGEDSDAVARPDPDPRQSAAQPFDALVEAGPRMVAPRLLIFIL